MPRVRLLLVVVLGLLALAPAAGAATRNQILRDCEDDSRLSKNYSNRELRDARNNINSGLDAYSDCRDVLSAAIAANARRKGGGTGGGSSDGGTTGGGSATGGGTATGGGAAGAPGGAPPAPPPPISPEERRALDTARSAGEDVDIAGQRVVPGVGVAGASAGGELPGSLLVGLILLALGALGAGVPYLRRRVLTRRPA